MTHYRISWWNWTTSGLLIQLWVASYQIDYCGLSGRAAMRRGTGLEQSHPKHLHAGWTAGLEIDRSIIYSAGASTQLVGVWQTTTYIISWRSAAVVECQQLATSRPRPPPCWPDQAHVAGVVHRTAQTHGYSMHAVVGGHGVNLRPIPLSLNQIIHNVKLPHLFIHQGSIYCPSPTSLYGSLTSNSSHTHSAPPSPPPYPNACAWLFLLIFVG